jgi:hypothetical protein
VQATSGTPKRAAFRERRYEREQERERADDPSERHESERGTSSSTASTLRAASLTRCVL